MYLKKNSTYLESKGAIGLYTYDVDSKSVKKKYPI